MSGLDILWKCMCRVQSVRLVCNMMDDLTAFCWGSNYAALMGSGAAPPFEPQLILGSSVELRLTAPRCPALVGYEPTSSCAGMDQVLQFTSNSLIYTHLLNFSVIQGCTPGVLSTIAPNRTITLPCMLASTASAQVCVDAAALMPGRDISVYSPGSMQCDAIRPSPSATPSAASSEPSRARVWQTTCPWTTCTQPVRPWWMTMCSHSQDHVRVYSLRSRWGVSGHAYAWASPRFVDDGMS